MRACSDKVMRTSGVGARPLITLSLASPTAARIACESSTCCSACGRKGAGAHAPTTGANPNTLTSYDMPTFRLCKEGEHVARARQHHENDLCAPTDGTHVLPLAKLQHVTAFEKVHVKQLHPHEHVVRSFTQSNPWSKAFGPRPWRSARAHRRARGPRHRTWKRPWQNHQWPRTRWPPRRRWRRVASRMSSSPRGRWASVQTDQRRQRSSAPAGEIRVILTILQFLLRAGLRSRRGRPT